MYLFFLSFDCSNPCVCVCVLGCSLFLKTYCHFATWGNHCHQYVHYCNIYFFIFNMFFFSWSFLFSLKYLLHLSKTSTFHHFYVFMCHNVIKMFDRFRGLTNMCHHFYNNLHLFIVLLIPINTHIVQYMLTLLLFCYFTIIIPILTTCGVENVLVHKKKFCLFSLPNSLGF
jgi:hypothetical protein